MREPLIFIGRKDERQTFHQLINEREKAVLCLKGRSKMGKTHLSIKIHEELGQKINIFSSFYQFRSGLEDVVYPFVASLGELVHSAEAKDGVVDKARHLVDALASEPRKTALRLAGAAYRGARAGLLNKLKEYFQYEEVMEEATSILEEKIQQAGKLPGLDELLVQSRPAVISSYLGLLENLSEYTDPNDRYVLILDQMEHAPESAVEFLMTLVRELPPRCYLLFSLNIEHPRGGDIWKASQSELRANDVEVVELEPFGPEEIRELILARGKVVPSLDLLKEAERATGGRPFSLDAWIQSDDFDRGVIRKDEKFQFYQLEQLETCTPEARKIAQTVAPLPQPPLQGLKDYTIIFKTTALEVEERLKELVRKNLFIRTGGQYWFIHEEVQENILNDMDPSVKEELAIDLIERLKVIEPYIMEQPSQYSLLAASILPWTDNPDKTFTLNSRWGEYFYSISEFLVALEHFKRALKEAEALGDRQKQSYCLTFEGLIYQTWGQQDQALNYYEQALIINQELGDQRSEATTLNNIGGVYSALGQKDKALEYFEQALSIRREVGDRLGEATTLNSIGGIYSDLGHKDKALAYFEQTLPIRREVGDLRGEATTLNNIGGIYSDLGQKDKVLANFEKALQIYREEGDRYHEAMILNNIAGEYSSLGQKRKALEYYEQALHSRREMGDRQGEATTLNNIGMLNFDLCKDTEALTYFKQALPIFKELGDRTGEGTSLNNIGMLFYRLEKADKALIFSKQALPILREVGDRAREAMALSNIGLAYSALGEKEKALKYFEQALPICRKVGHRAGEATTLNNIGGVHDELGQKEKALGYFEQALVICHEVKYRSGEASTLNNIGWVYLQLGQMEKALEYFRQALPIRCEVGDRAGEATTLRNIATIFSIQGKLLEAISLMEHVVAIEEEIASPKLEENLAVLDMLRQRHK